MKAEDCTFDRIVYLMQHGSPFKGRIVSPVLTTPST
jgi:hypothetical protein